MPGSSCKCTRSRLILTLRPSCHFLKKIALEFGYMLTNLGQPNFPTQLPNLLGKVIPRFLIANRRGSKSGSMKNEWVLVAGAECVIRFTATMLIAAANYDLEPGIALGLETSAAINNSEAVLSFKGANECCVNSSRIFDVEEFIHHYYTETSFGEGFQGTG
ncbi:hypothetical protein CDAR_101251 [Caerostris darwini]|uniref:Uncharacterized protein n=1 Tax=Caerostris darwini TaxID=1538125 RepID=A0AAV4QFV2_9ARAC|nr:hypothetical protein CDAR_101251 [Caerostris darwini]